MTGMRLYNRTGQTRGGVCIMRSTGLAILSTNAVSWNNPSNRYMWLGLFFRIWNRLRIHGNILTWAVNFRKNHFISLNIHIHQGHRLCASLSQGKVSTWFCSLPFVKYKYCSKSQGCYRFGAWCVEDCSATSRFEFVWRSSCILHVCFYFLSWFRVIFCLHVEPFYSWSKSGGSGPLQFGLIWKQYHTKRPIVFK